MQSGPMQSGYAVGPGPSRRFLLAGLAGLAALPVASGCGVRLEEDAPSLPLVPRRTPVPGEVVLLDLLAGTLALAAFCESATGTDPMAAQLAAIHRTQAGVLHDALLRDGVPTSVLGRAVSPSPARTLPANLAAAEASSAGDVTRFAPVAGALVPSVLALIAQRLAATTVLTPAEAGADPRLGRTVPAALPDSARHPVPAGAALGEALTAARDAVHHFEVVQARTPNEAADGQRGRALATTTWLTALAERWEGVLGDAAPVAPVAVVLPFPVDSPEAAARLASHTLDRLRGAYGRVLSTVTDPVAPAVWAALPVELADIEVHAHDWAVALAPFPGLA